MLTSVSIRIALNWIVGHSARIIETRLVWEKSYLSGVRSVRSVVVVWVRVKGNHTGEVSFSFIPPFSIYPILTIFQIQILELPPICRLSWLPLAIGEGCGVGCFRGLSWGSNLSFAWISETILYPCNYFPFFKCLKQVHVGSIICSQSTLNEMYGKDYPYWLSCIVLNID